MSTADQEPAPGRDEPLPDLLDENGPDRPHAVRLALLLGALVCLALGIIGWLVPVVTGVPFYILGAVLAGMASRRTARWINCQERRLPHRLRRALRPKRRRARREEDRTGHGP